MIKLKVNKKDEGILYILYVWHEDEKLVKIGVTKKDTVLDRVIEIISSYYAQWRVFPKVYPKRHRKTDGVFKKEAMLHRYYADKKIEFCKKFSGCTEFFRIDDEEELLDTYERVLKGETV